MVIFDFNVVRIAIAPHEADAPLIVDANAALSLSVAFERLQLITGGRREVTEFCRDVQLPKFPLCHPLETSESLDVLPRMELCCLLRPEGLDHTLIV